MSTSKPLALYQIETFGDAMRHRSNEDRARPVRPPAENAARPGPEPVGAAMRASAGPSRASEFLVQLMVGVDPDLRRALGRRDLSDRRDAAYASALAKRTSARATRALRVIGTA